MKKIIFLFLILFVLFGFTITQASAGCSIVWSGSSKDYYGTYAVSGSAPTAETSRTEQAAKEMYSYLLPGCGTPNFTNNCYGSSLYILNGAFECETRACIEGGWSFKNGCKTSPACLFENTYGSGNWDVICDNTTTTIIPTTTSIPPVTTTTTSISNTTTTVDYWSYTYGGSQNDDCYSLQATSGGGGVVVGLTESFGVGYRDLWVLKLDNQGNIAWQKRYGGSGLDAAYSVLQTSDGGYMVQGYTGSYGAGDFDILLLKLDINGNIIWQKAYGGPNFERGYSIKQTMDNGFVIGGYTGTDGAAEGSSNDIVVLKVDADGNLSWMKTYGGSKGDHAKAITATSDGGSLVTGFTESFGAGGRDLFVLKLDGSGNVTWMNTYGTSGNDVSYANGLESEDGSYMVAGATNSFGTGDFDFWLLKLDITGNIIWQKTYGGTSRDVSTSLQHSSDGGYILTGQTTSFGAGDYDTLLLKLDSDGKIIWQKNYGGPGDGHAFAVQESINGDFILAGFENSSGAGGDDYSVMKVDSGGDIPDCHIAGTSNAIAMSSTVQPISISISAVSFPNPVTTVTHFNPVNTSVSASNFCGSATLISLSSFKASPSNKEVNIKWVTESEIDNAGFNLYRAASENGDYIRINASIIPAHGSPTQGAVYEFIDSGLKNGKTYYYKLDDVDLNGTATMHGPVSAMPRLIYGNM